MEQLSEYFCEYYTYEFFSTSFQVVKRLFVPASSTAADDANNEAGTKDNKNYFFPRGEINNYNVLIVEQIFMINQLMN